MGNEAKWLEVSLRGQDGVTRGKVSECLQSRRAVTFEGKPTGKRLKFLQLTSILTSGAVIYILRVINSRDPSASYDPSSWNGTIPPFNLGPQVTCSFVHGLQGEVLQPLVIFPNLSELECETQKWSCGTRKQHCAKASVCTSDSFPEIYTKLKSRRSQWQLF